MTTFTFAPATRETAKARIALQGPGGSGKTKTALRMAEGLAAGGPIGVVDTERGSALKYAPVPGRPDIESHEFAHLPMAFCSPENLIAAVKAAEEARLAVLILDSWSHFWAGKGGLLARVDQEAKKPGHFGGSYTAWAPVNDLEQDMLDALLGFPGHVIVTMRTKNDYEMEGKKVTKVGVKTIQREGAEYEFDVVMDMVKGTGTVTKTRYTPLDNVTLHHPGEDFAETILEQLGQGVDPVVVITDALAAEGLTLDDILRIQGDAASRRLTQTGLLHPTSGEPTTVAALMQERLGETLIALLADDFLTYERALALFARGGSGGWLNVPYADRESGEITTLGALIKARGTELKAKAEPAPPTIETTRDSGAGDEQQPAPATPGEGATAPQTRKIFASMKELGLAPEDRDQRLRAVGLLIGRRIESMNTLTFGEASVVIETFADFTGDGAPERFRAHLNDLLAKAA
ncbi:AAA family ATPase [Streptomyces sp. NPDC050738]|uniref:AAA family ATPase n=1 Tax=Streptomyces sp. NPDC050738 TaxID=3154744 RepID=UPI003426EE96